MLWVVVGGIGIVTLFDAVAATVACDGRVLHGDPEAVRSGPQQVVNVAEVAEPGTVIVAPPGWSVTW